MASPVVVAIIALIVFIVSVSVSVIYVNIQVSKLQQKYNKIQKRLARHEEKLETLYAVCEITKAEEMLVAKEHKKKAAVKKKVKQ